jgi:endonuclease-3
VSEGHRPVARLGQERLGPPARDLLLAARLEEIDRRLVARFGEPVWQLRLDPLSELIAAVLSQNTSDRNSRRAFEELRQRFPTWEAVREAAPEEIAAAIRSGGLANVKAPRIKAILQELTRRFGTLDLWFLCDLPRHEVEALLLRLPGVGAKSVAIVLLFSCGRPAMPVDTHVHRVARRLGVVPERAGPERTQRILEAHTAPERMYALHVNFIRLGRQICKAPRPLCERCPLCDLCAYWLRLQAPAAEPASPSTQPAGHGEGGA